MEFTTKYDGLVARVEHGIDRELPPADAAPGRLHQAMRYSLQAGGKRLRPILVLGAAELLDPGEQIDPVPAAVAVECIHTYSLIHDDLPCMDNDDLRRGRPTCHRAFDEPTALLAGDALFAHAFLLLNEAYASRPSLAVGLCRELAIAAGSRQLVGGQMLDLLAEKSTGVTDEMLHQIHDGKTAAMIRASLVFGGLIGGAEPEVIATLRAGGTNLGMAFQILDDILDTTSDAATLGKTPGKDANAGKATFVTLHGLEASRRTAEAQSAAAMRAFRSLPGDTTFLLELVHRLTTRTH
jgi:geranylgeranyl diphosphate synthase, type II